MQNQQEREGMRERERTHVVVGILGVCFQKASPLFEGSTPSGVMLVSGICRFPG